MSAANNKVLECQREVLILSVAKNKVLADVKSRGDHVALREGKVLIPTARLRTRFLYLKRDGGEKKESVAENTGSFAQVFGESSGALP